MDHIETGDVTVWVTVDDSRDGFLTGDMKGERAGNDGNVSGQTTAD